MMVPVFLLLLLCPSWAFRHWRPPSVEDIYVPPRFNSFKKPLHDARLTELFQHVLGDMLHLKRIDGAHTRWEFHSQFSRPFCPLPPYEAPPPGHTDYYCNRYAGSGQYVNPCPGGTSLLGCKSIMCQLLRGEPYAAPCYMLPAERHLLYSEIEDRGVYFVKPQAHVAAYVTSGQQLREELYNRPNRHLTIQQRFEDPFLVEGRKMEVRVLVVVSSYVPLRIYASRHLLVKTASQEYSAAYEEADNVCMHVLNRARDMAFEGHCPYTKDPYMDWEAFSNIVGREVSESVWASVVDATIRSLIKTAEETERLTQPCLVNDAGCMNLWGYDYFIAADHQAGLLEVNALPLLVEVEHHNKTLVLRDALRIVGGAGYDRTSYHADVTRKLSVLCMKYTCTQEDKESIMQYEDERHHRGTTEVLFPTLEGLSTYDAMMKESFSPSQQSFSALLYAYLLLD